MATKTQKTPRKAAEKKTARKSAPKRARRKEPPGGPPTPADARAKALAQKIAAAVLDKKATDVVILDMRGLTSYADYLVIASGESERQVSAMAEHVREQLRADGVRPIGSEGEDTGQWVLLDFGEVVAHLFFDEVRAFYDLEGLWADAPREMIA